MSAVRTDQVKWSDEMRWMGENVTVFSLHLYSRHDGAPSCYQRHRFAVLRGSEVWILLPDLD